MSNSVKSPAFGDSLPCAANQVDEFLSRPTAAVISILARTPGPFLILGAGGKIGLHLSMMIRRVLNKLGRSDPVIAVSRFRTLRDRAAFTEHGIVVETVDLNDSASLAALPDAPTVFFLAGIKFGTAAAPELLHQFNVVLPGKVAERFHRSRIVAFSTGCVYPFLPPDSGGATEETGVAPVGDYALSCLAREQAFSDASLRHGTKIAFIRLNYAVEFRYGVLVDIAQNVLQGQTVDVTTGFVNAIWQSDAVAYSIQALELAAAPPMPLNVTGADILAVREVAQRFGALLQRPVRIVGEEAKTAWLNDASHSHRLFGKPSIGVEDMFCWIALWLSGAGATWGKPTGFQQRAGQF